MSTRPGRTNGRLYCCEADGQALFTVDCYREGKSWYTAEGRVLKNFLTELFHESPNVKQARLIVPAQNIRVFFTMRDGTATAVYGEPIEGPRNADRRTRKSDSKNTFESPNLGGKQ
jgi:hypothetical protein